MAHSGLSVTYLVVVILTSLLLINTPRAFGTDTCGFEGTVGTTYTRWGRCECPGTATLVYEGVVAKSYYTHLGGGKEYICLSRNPQWPDDAKPEFQHQSYIYGVEYERISDKLQDHAAPCSVCHVTGRSDHLMIPGRNTCPTGWTMEYAGMLVSSLFSHQGANYVCLDNEPEVVPNSQENKNGGLFYRVEAVCGNSLPCPPYINGFELTCVVCTI